MHLRIREARRRAGLSQEDFAADIGVTRGAVAQWEMEHGTAPSIRNLERIAKISGLHFEWLGTGRGPKKYGEPVIHEEPANYKAVHSRAVQSLVAYATRMERTEPARLRALLAFLGIS